MPKYTITITRVSKMYPWNITVVGGKTSIETEQI